MNIRSTLTHSRLLAVALLLGVLAIVAPARAQDTLHFDQHVVVTELGDATFTIKMKFTASQFQQWQQRYGMNPSLFRRETIRSLSQYNVTDFKLEKNDLEREVAVTIVATGVTRYKGDGVFEIDLPKTWRLVNQSGSELKFNYIEPMAGGGTIQHHIVANLPKNARDVSEPVPAEGGMVRITYQLPVESRSSVMLILGGLLAVAGLAVMVVGFVKPAGASSAKA